MTPFDDARKDDNRTRSPSLDDLITGAPKLRLVLSDTVNFNENLGSWHAWPIL
jgi:hypothetical protein